ncbi:hypothetical protein HOLleu_24250 [Holothuria leucospilota]|uniref:SAM domain-containing protein n=1 Tax=Holothuria leucospilota TaxID=206669 RepID=A0A9Q1BW77_HOLLE|nr:hypothetical protein HOLleu_24250 [Holothuria leucospilota]
MAEECSVGDVGMWLKENDFSEGDVEHFKENEIDGQTMLSLNDRMLADLFPSKIAKQVRFRKLLKSFTDGLSEGSMESKSNPLDKEEVAEEESMENGWPQNFKFPSMPPRLQEALNKKD